MNLINTMSKQRICILKTDNKTGVLSELIEIISKSDISCDIEMLKKKIFYRENLMSTGIGLGIGIPHVRMEGIETPFITIGIHHQDIQDYASIDDQIIKIVIMIVAGKNQHKEYIKLLSQLVNLIKNHNIANKILKAENAEEIYEIISSEA